MSGSLSNLWCDDDCSPISVHVVMFNIKVKRCVYTDVYTYTSASTETSHSRAQRHDERRQSGKDTVRPMLLTCDRVYRYQKGPTHPVSHARVPELV